MACSRRIKPFSAPNSLRLLLILSFCAACGGVSPVGDADVIQDASTDADAEQAEDAGDGGECTRPSDCSDGLYCNGEEQCNAGRCGPGEPPLCDDTDECTTDSCSNDLARCVFSLRDEDGDGYTDSRCGGQDCDDSDEAVYPGAPERCNDRDDNCDGVEVGDLDNDGVNDTACGGTDCDDNDRTVYPGAPESGCDTIDNDCDGDDAEGPADIDDDGWVSLECGGADCDDTDEHVHPEAEERCNNVDDDCNGMVDRARDDEEEGFQCAQGQLVECETTCGTIGAARCTALCMVPVDGCEPPAEICNGDDDDCDGATDEPVTRFVTQGMNPKIVWNGSALGMVWRVAGQGFFATFDLAELASLVPVAVGAVQVETRVIDLAWSGEYFGVVRRGADGERGPVLYDVVNTDQEVVVGDVVVPSTAEASRPRDVAIEWAGDSFAIAWADREDGVHHVRLRWSDVEGELGELVAVAQDGRVPSMRWTGATLGLVWRVLSDELAVRFLPSVSSGEPVGEPLTLCTSFGLGCDSPAVAWDATARTYAVSWIAQETGNIHSLSLALVDGAGEIESTESWDRIASFQYVDIASRPGSFGLAWTEGQDIFFAESNGTVLSAPVVSNEMGNNPSAPSIVWTGSAYIIAWSDHVAGQDRIYLATVSCL